MSKANEILNFNARETIRGHLHFLAGKATTCGDDLELAGKYANECFGYLISILSKEEKSIDQEMLEALKLLMDFNPDTTGREKLHVYEKAKAAISRAEAQGAK